MTDTDNERGQACELGLEIPLALGDASQSYRSKPRAGTVVAAILSALEGGRALTSGDAWREFGTSRLASFVHVLKRRGWPIVAEEVEVSSRDGRVARVARYRLVEAKNEPQEKAAW